MRIPPGLAFATTASAMLLLLLIAPVRSASPAPSIEDFVLEANIRDAELSPDGKYLAMIINEPERTVVVVRNVETPDMPVIGAFAETIVRPSWLYWASNDRLLISMSVPYDTYLKKIQRSAYFEGDGDLEFSRMVSVNPDMSDMAILMEDERKLRNNYSLSRVSNSLPNDPDHVLMAAYRLGKRILYKVNINSGESEFIASGSSRTYKFLNGDDGEPLYRFDFREGSKSIEIFKFKNDDEWELVDSIRLSKDDESGIDRNELVALYAESVVYRKRNAGTGYYDLILIDRTTSEQRILASLPQQDVFGAIFHPRSDQIIGYRVETDYLREVYFDDVTQEQYDAIAAQLENYNFDVSALAPGLRKVLVGVHGADAPYTYYLWDTATQKLTFLDHAFHRLPPEILSSPATMTYVARDGTPLRAYVLLPKSYASGKTYPTIILPHGGPQSRSRPDYDGFAQFLSSRGYIVVEPNFRGSVGYGLEFEAAGYKQWGGLMQDDLTDAAEFMIKKGYADPTRICIVGGSYGGYAALMGAIKTPDLFACAVSINGVTNLSDLVKYDMRKSVDEAEWGELLFDRVGHPDKDRDMLAANSPALNADKISIPVLVVGATADDIVPYDQAKQMVAALKKAKVRYEFVSLKDAGHNFYSDDKTMTAVFKAVEDFLAKHLQENP